MHGEGHKRGVEPACCDQDGQEPEPGRPAGGGQGRDDQQPGRIPGGDSEAPVHQQTDQPPAPSHKVDVDADNTEFTRLDKVVTGLIGSPSTIDQLMSPQVQDAGGRSHGHDGQRRRSPAGAAGRSPE